MTFDNATLMAYADGELDPVQRAAVEQAMRDDPLVAAAVERHRALRRDVSGAFAAILDEPVPERLQPDLAARVVQLNAARVRRVQPAEQPQRPARRRWSWPEWGALAASLALGILLGQNGPGGGAQPAIGGDGGTLAAHGELAQALDQQPSGARTGVARVSISFAARDGGYCRGFVYGPSAGLACRQGDTWRIPVLAESPSQAEGSYRQAGSALPPAVLDAIDARIAGAPLDAEGEAAARGRGWKTPSTPR
ncbi:anti-sigma factor family protein [Massilia sp. DD77]|uniref:anti-sigma factor family protein n=1 Tax=Massilia sp. DD77 TaxID=3109349 RepID=UPI00300017AC